MGLDAGLKVLDEVRRQIGVPILTDVHDESQVKAVASVVGFTGGGRSGNANLFIALKPKAERNRLEQTKGEHSADQVITRLRAKLSREAGASLFLQAMQDIRIGGRAASSQFQYTLKADSLTALREWEPIIRRRLAEVPEIKDINTDQEDHADQINIMFNREAMARLGITQQVANAALANLFSQRLVATTYQPLNQYRVVLESNQSSRDNISDLDQVQIINNSGNVVHLSAIASWQLGKSPSSINHQDGFAASTISFNLAAGVAMSDAERAVQSALTALHMPKEIVGGFQGTAKAYQQTTNNQPWLILAAIVAVYLVLGMLYESWLHPITILSTLPSAGVGALLMLMLMKMEFSLMALVGVILLIGIVKKNAIMMVDFALQSQKTKGTSPREAIYQACLLRLRPILMTTVAAIAGALPLALCSGDGAELRQPLGVAMIGGLILSQVLTLYTTPIVYLGLERLKAAINPRKIV
jgi:multidrug efflux pump